MLLIEQIDVSFLDIVHDLFSFTIIYLLRTTRLHIYKMSTFLTH